LAVYLLQKEYGENWKEHASPELLKYYDEMQKRKNQSSSDSEENSGDTPENTENGFNII
jgi:hypothetical protein